MGEFYVPRYRGELLDILEKYYPESMSKFRKMGKSRLYAIYYNKVGRLLRVRDMLYFDKTQQLNKLVSLVDGR